nr:unnamed protein product [Digitaria exilis]
MATLGGVVAIIKVRCLAGSHFPLPPEIEPGPGVELVAAPAVVASYSPSDELSCLKLAMASGEAAEQLQYTTTVLRVSIHCEGCKKKVKKVLHNIEGVYKVTVDAAQHKVTVTGSLGADALIKRLHKAGKQAALWPAPASPATVAKKPEEVAPAVAPPAVEGCVKGAAADKAEAKPKEKEKKQPEAEGKDDKKPEKEKGAEKKAQKAEAAKPKDDEGNKDVEVTAPKEKKGAAAEPAKKESAAAEDEAAAGEESGSGKKGNNKKKNKQKDGVDEPETAASAEKTPPQPSMAPSPAVPGPERPHVGGFAYYAAAAQPVMSYNVAHPSSSVSYYAPTPMQQQPLPTPPPPPYGYPAAMMPEFMYGPPGMRSSPPQESYNNMFNEENANSCTVM